ncbi:hypothetical protein H0H87_006166, partial [Tephrocybe sp. NHM501043]
IKSQLDAFEKAVDDANRTWKVIQLGMELNKLEQDMAEKITKAERASEKAQLKQLQQRVHCGNFLVRHSTKERLDHNDSGSDGDSHGHTYESPESRTNQYSRGHRVSVGTLALGPGRSSTESSENRSSYSQSSSGAHHGERPCNYSSDQQDIYPGQRSGEYAQQGQSGFQLHETYGGGAQRSPYYGNAQTAAPAARHGSQRVAFDSMQEQEEYYERKFSRHGRAASNFSAPSTLGGGHHDRNDPSVHNATANLGEDMSRLS